MTGTISIVIPTFRRPQPLQRALASVVRQQAPEGVTIEIVVVDNSPEGQAREAVAAFVSPRHALRYIHAPNPGIANARNAGIAAAEGEWIAFLDDDEEAGANWIPAFWHTLSATGADAAFGPVLARPEQAGGTEELLGYFARRIEADEGEDLKPKSAYLGTNNSIFSRSRCFPEAQCFDPALNESGGEDTLVIQRLVHEKRKLCWSAGAEVLEWIPASRLNFAYVGRRRFLSGQIRSFVLTMLKPPRWHELAFWMMVGVAQVLIGGLQFLAFALIDRRRMENARLRIMSGLGKIFWMRSFRPGLYGHGLVS